MKNSSTKSLLIFFSFLSVLFLAILIFGVYYIKSKTTHIHELVSKVELNSNNGLLIQTIKSSQNATTSEISELENISLSKDKLVNFIEMLEQMAKEIGLKVQIVSVSAEENSDKDKTDAQKVNIKIETTGSWKPTIQFVHLIENLPYRTIINSSDLSVDKNGTASVIVGTSTEVSKSSWKSNLSITLYSFE